MTTSPGDPPLRDVRTTRVPFGDDEFAIVSFPLTSGLDLGALTRAERGIVEALRLEATPQRIAEARGTARSTVENQIAAIYEKLGVASHSELIARLARG